MVKKLLIFILLILLSGCGNKNNDSNLENSINVSKESLSFKECQEIGGEIVDTGNIDSQDCPDNKEYLGVIHDVWCKCICCK